MSPEGNMENISPDPLTCIHNAYTLFDTPEDATETNQIIVKHFLQTLAEIALAVASRKSKEND
jgi:hypothetical protein